MDRALPKVLKNLGLSEAHVKKFNLPSPASHITRSQLIDSVWVSSNITPIAVSVFPHKFGTGDNRVILVDAN